MHFGFWQHGETDNRCEVEREKWERDNQKDAVWKTRKIKGEKTEIVTDRGESE